YGVWPNSHVDHINRDPSDNRITNLRLASPEQNRSNMPGRAGSASAYKGVSFSHGKKKWMAKIGMRGKQKYLGYFAREEDAARAYDTAAYAYAGEYALLNFPRGRASAREREQHRRQYEPHRGPPSRS